MVSQTFQRILINFTFGEKFNFNKLYNSCEQTEQLCCSVYNSLFPITSSSSLFTKIGTERRIKVLVNLMKAEKKPELDTRAVSPNKMQLYLVQVSGTLFWYQKLILDSWACVTIMSVENLKRWQPSAMLDSA